MVGHNNTIKRVPPFMKELEDIYNICYSGLNKIDKCIFVKKIKRRINIHEIDMYQLCILHYQLCNKEKIYKMSYVQEDMDISNCFFDRGETKIYFSKDGNIGCLFNTNEKKLRIELFKNVSDNGNFFFTCMNSILINDLHKKFFIYESFCSFNTNNTLLIYSAENKDQRLKKEKNSLQEKDLDAWDKLNNGIYVETFGEQFNCNSFYLYLYNLLENNIKYITVKDVTSCYYSPQFIDENSFVCLSYRTTPYRLGIYAFNIRPNDLYLCTLNEADLKICDDRNKYKSNNTNNSNNNNNNNDNNKAYVRCAYTKISSKNFKHTASPYIIKHEDTVYVACLVVFSKNQECKQHITEYNLVLIKLNKQETKSTSFLQDHEKENVKEKAHQNGNINININSNNNSNSNGNGNGNDVHPNKVQEKKDENLLVNINNSTIYHPNESNEKRNSLTNDYENTNYSYEDNYVHNDDNDIYINGYLKKFQNENTNEENNNKREYSYDTNKQYDEDTCYDTLSDVHKQYTCGDEDDLNNGYHNNNNNKLKEEDGCTYHMHEHKDDVCNYTKVQTEILIKEGNYTTYFRGLYTNEIKGCCYPYIFLNTILYCSKIVVAVHMFTKKIYRILISNIYHEDDFNTSIEILTMKNDNILISIRNMLLNDVLAYCIFNEKNIHGDYIYLINLKSYNLDFHKYESLQDGNICTKHAKNSCDGKHNNICDGKHNNICDGNHNNICDGNHNNICDDNHNNNICDGNHNNNNNNNCDGHVSTQKSNTCKNHKGSILYLSLNDNSKKLFMLLNEMVTSLFQDKHPYIRRKDAHFNLLYENENSFLYDIQEKNFSLSNFNLFNKKKLRNLILYIHGGPYSITLNEYKNIFIYFAASGFDVLCVNYIGSLSFSDKLNILSGHINSIEIDDIINIFKDFVNYFGDYENIYLYGGSYGAFASCSLLTKYNSLFKSACIINGVYEWILSTYSSDVPDFFLNITRNKFSEYDYNLSKEDYEQLYDMSPINFAHNISSPILIISSKDDKRVSYHNSIALYNKLRALKKKCKLFLFQNTNHSIDNYSYDETMLLNIILWFYDYDDKRKK
ncbi:peptidase, putative [Plasmodium reichenowi]|uniref:Peptidase, putative n=1 Tax=Plasmodium reichenowi TaxID=5854 RepID=A0A151LU49_PLARE|nr:peptidase, putative [Plasmodium reichenowi]KYO02709.1 peptidase, putative [Plasmodium reichenowi]